MADAKVLLMWVDVVHDYDAFISSYMIRQLKFFFLVIWESQITTPSSFLSNCDFHISNFEVQLLVYLYHLSEFVKEKLISLWV